MNNEQGTMGAIICKEINTMKLQLRFIFILAAWLFLTVGVYAQEVKLSENDAVFNVVVTSKSGKPRQGEVISLNSRKTKKSFLGTTTPDGKCTIIIPSADKYDIYYKYFSQQVRYRDIEVPGGDHRMIYTFTMKYDPPRVFALKNVFFDTGKSTLRKESNTALDELAEALKTKPSMVIEIAGHTDDVGTSESNLQLSEGRANEVRKYLIKSGISPGRVVAKGYGESQAVADNSTEDGRQQNRRTEVRIISD